LDEPRDALLIFAREPQQAQKKLRSALPGAFVTKLASAFLRDTLAVAASLEDVVVRVAYSPRSAAPRFSEFLSEQELAAPHGLVRQRGRALGARLEAAFRETFATGATRVVAIGTDSPSLPVESIRAGFEMLRQHDCVIGPTLDGGYYLIGLSRACYAIFRGIEWTGATVYRDTVEIIQRESLSYRELPVWYDVDTAEDLEFLVRDINQFRLTGDEQRAQHTEAVLARMLQVDA
jgi:rSAM/selenodomain-associated transferase 1